MRYKRGVEFYKQGEYEKAIEEFKRVLELKPEHANAKKYLESSQNKKNQKVVNKLYDQAQGYYRQKEYQKALDTYNEVLKIVQDDGYSQYNIALLRARIAKIEKRSKQLREREFARLTKDTVKKKEVMKEEADIEQERLDEEQQIEDIKEDIDEAVEIKRTKEELMKLLGDIVQEAEESVSQKDKRIPEIVSSIPTESIDRFSLLKEDDGFIVLKEMNEKAKEERVKLTYNIAKEYYRNRDYERAIEAFNQVISLEEMVTKKRYTPYAQKYIRWSIDKQKETR